MYGCVIGVCDNGDYRPACPLLYDSYKMKWRWLQPKVYDSSTNAWKNIGLGGTLWILLRDSDGNDMIDADGKNILVRMTS